MKNRWIALPAIVAIGVVLLLALPKRDVCIISKRGRMGEARPIDMQGISDFADSVFLKAENDGVNIVEKRTSRKAHQQDQYIVQYFYKRPGDRTLRRYEYLIGSKDDGTFSILYEGPVGLRQESTGLADTLQ